MKTKLALEKLILDLEKVLNSEILRHKKLHQLTETDEYCKGIICAKKIALTLIDELYAKI